MYIEINNLTKIIKHTPVLQNISLRLEQGHIYGLKGRNGSGKTMLMRCICGLILPTEGSIVINGEQLGKEISFPRSVGALIENPAFLNNYTGFQNLKILASIQGNIDNEQIKDTLTRVGLEPDDKRKYRKYSLGMKQRLGIASAIMEQPDIIVLDEPTNALDEQGICLVRKILTQEKERGALIVLSCHDTQELNDISDVIYTLDAGKLIPTKEVSHEQEKEN